MEPPDSAAQYSEPLTLLPGIGTRFARPELPPARRTRSAAKRLLRVSFEPSRQLMV